MSITVAFDNSGSKMKYQRISRSHAMITGTITFDDSYDEGGESISDIVGSFFTNNGTVFSPIMALDVDMPNGLRAVLDKSTAGSEVLRVYDPFVPPIVFEEVFDADSDTATLKYPAAHIDYIATEAAPIIPIFGGVTPASGQAAVAMGYDIDTGVLTKGVQPTLTFASGEGSATTYCSYVTQAWKDVVDNMEACKALGNGTDMTDSYATGMTWAADVYSLSKDIIAMTSMTWCDGGLAGTIKVPELLVDGGTPAATLETEIDFINSGDAEVTTNNDAMETSGDITFFQYIKYPASGFLKERFINSSMGGAADVITFTGNPLMYGSCGQLPMSTSDKKCYLVTIADTVAATQGHFTTVAVKPSGATTPTITMEGATDDNAVPAWINGAIGEIHTQAIEVPGADYSGLGAIRFRAIGLIQAF